MKRINLLFTAIVSFTCLSNLSAQDWLQYMGPNRNYISSQKGILRSWSQNGPEVLWTADLGIGFGGPVINDPMINFLLLNYCATCIRKKIKNTGI